MTQDQMKIHLVAYSSCANVSINYQNQILLLTSYAIL